MLYMLTFTHSALAPRRSDVPGYNVTADTEKAIPRHLWVALRNASDELNWHMQGLFNRNPGWRVHLEGNDVSAGRVLAPAKCAASPDALS